MYGLGLYLGEGGKTHDLVRITNSDGGTIRAAVFWLKSLGVESWQLTARLHAYPDTNEADCIKYWSNITTIPKSQFLKTQVDLRTVKRRKNHGKLPHGTLHVGVRSGGRKEFGVRFHRKIQAWNKAILNQINAELV